MALQAPELQHAFHANLGVVAQHGRVTPPQHVADRLARGVFRSIPELIAAIEEYIFAHNQNPKPFV